ncbi:MAG: hypothetical protein IJ620_04095 [Bacteroidales bacterium]|nr:hypothetical protein [Bacteroidales bacterium]
MKNHKRLKFILFFLPVLVPVSVSAQDDSSTYNESVVIHGNFNPVIERFDKLNVAPYITDSATTLDHRFSYQIDPYRITSVFEPSRFKPVKLTGEPRTRLYHSYLRLGMGNYWSPLLDAYYSSTTSHNLNYGVRLNHHSSWDKIGDKDKPESFYGPNHYSLTDVALFGKYIVNDKFQVYTDLSYENDYNLYYGFCDTMLAHFGQNRDNIKTAEYKAPYNYIGWNVGINSIKPNARFVYDARLHVSDLMGSYGQNEFHFAADSKVGYRFALGRSNTLLAALRLKLDGFSQNINNESLQPLFHLSDTMPSWQPDSSYTPHATRILFAVNPFAETQLGGFHIHAGLRVALDGYDKRGTMSTHLFPDVMVTRNFMDNALGVSLGATGDAEAVSWNNIRLINPYMAPASEVATQRYNDFFANIRYSFSKKLELDVHASYRMIENRLSFMLDDQYLLGNVMRPKYEDLNRFALGMDFAFVNDELLAIAIGGNYYNYNTAETDSMPPLYAVPYDLHLRVDLNHNNKFLFHLNFKLIGAMDAAFDYDAVRQEYVITHTVPMRYGMDFEFEYRHNRALSAFLRIDNLLFQRYFYWQNYPSQRALFTLGATYTIPTKQ